MKESFEKGAWEFQNNEFWVDDLWEKGKQVSFSDRKGKKQYDYSFYNSELKIYLTFTRFYDKDPKGYGRDTHSDSIKKHYELSTKRLSRMFETNIIEGKSYMNYFYFENSDDKEPQYQKLFSNFSWIQRRRLAKAYRELLKKSLIKMSGGTTTDVYLSKNKQLFRESRLSNLLDK